MPILQRHLVSCKSRRPSLAALASSDAAVVTVSCSTPLPAIVVQEGLLTRKRGPQDRLGYIVHNAAPLCRATCPRETTCLLGSFPRLEERELQPNAVVELTCLLVSDQTASRFQSESTRPRFLGTPNPNCEACGALLRSCKQQGSDPKSPPRPTGTRPCGARHWQEALQLLATFKAKARWQRASPIWE